MITRLFFITFLSFIINEVFGQGWQHQYDQLFQSYANGDFESVVENGPPLVMLAENEFGKESKSYIFSLKLITNSCYQLGLYQEGVNYGLEEIKYGKLILDVSSAEYGNSVKTLAMNYFGIGDFAQARNWLQEAIKIAESQYGSDSFQYAEILSDLANIEYQDGKLEEALSGFEKSIALSKTLGEINERVLYDLQNAGSLNNKLGHFEKAIDHLEFLIGILSDNDMKSSDLYLGSRIGLAQAYQSLGNQARSIFNYEDALFFMHDQGLEISEDYQFAFNELSKLYRASGRLSSFDSLMAANKPYLSSNGEQVDDVLSNIINQAVVYQNTGNYAKADELYKEAIQLIRAAEKTDYSLEAKLYVNYGLLRYFMNDLQEAENYGRMGVSIYRNHMVINQDYISALNNAAMIEKAIPDYIQSEMYLLEAKKICEESAPQLEEGYARTLENLSVLYFTMGKFRLAGEFMYESLGLRERMNGKLSLEYANLLNSFGTLSMSQGNYVQSGEILSECLQILNQIGQTRGTLYLQVLNNMGLYYLSLGNNSMADSIFNQAADVARSDFGEASREMANVWLNLARVYLATGKFNEAENKYRSAITIQQSVLGTSHPEYLTSTNALGVFYQTVGNYGEAEKIYLENKTRLSPSDPLYSTTLQNLSTIYLFQDKYDLAEPLLKEAVALDSIRYGIKHPEFAVSLQNLASLYQRLEKPEQAEPLFRKAIEIDQQVLGTTHPSYARKLFNLAVLYQDQGNYEQALPLLQESVAIRKNIFGTDHPDYAYGLYGLANINQILGNHSEAYSNYQEVIRIYLKQINEIFPAMSDKEKTAFYNKIGPVIEAYRDFAIEYSDDQPGILSDLFNLQLNTKALLLNASAKIKNTILNSGDSELISLYNEWTGLKEMIGKYYGFTRSELTEMSIQMDELEEQANALEKELSLRSELFSGEQAKKNINWLEVRNHLMETEAVIEIMRIRKNLKNDSIIYAALIVNHRTQEHPVLVIFPNGNLLEKKEYSRYINSIKYQLENDASYNLYWKPMDQWLAGINTIFISADGVYNKINLNTLFSPEEKNYVFDKYAVRLISNPKDIIKPSLEYIPSDHLAELIGFPDYKAGAKIQDEVPGQPDGLSALNLFRKGISPLPGTKVEVEKIETMLKQNNWQTRLLTGTEATEENLKRIQKPGLLHIATHGFFLDDVDFNRSISENDLGRGDQLNENPLFRSGLLLSGAEGNLLGGINHYLPGEEDGILTAYEAMNMNLDGTKLVVLSACETGLGDIRNGEGVYGLQRAIIISGAENLVMSLWKVNDATTQELMSGFYQEWLKGGNLFESFLNSQQELKRKFPDPYYWGAFVFIGK